jgi:hypothetical protein
MLGDLYKIFIQSPKRVHQLKNVEKVMDMPVLKAIEPSSTRWLAYERCVDRVLAIYPSLLISLQHIYQDAGNMSSTAGGLLLYLRNRDTVFIFSVLNHVLTSLGNLSRFFQTESSYLSESAAVTEATICSPEQLDCFDHAFKKAEELT